MPAQKESPARPTGVLLEDRFAAPDRLITNEYAYWNPRDVTAAWSPLWQVSSGSLFSSGGRGWTGPVDDVEPDVTSSNGTNSAIFRMTSRQRDFGDVSVSMDLEVRRCTTTPSTPRTDWDGVHLFLRHQSEHHLYYASVSRRDGRLAIKKKVPGGPSNGGTYHTLAVAAATVAPTGSSTRLAATVETLADGSVQIAILGPDRTVALMAVDSGVGGPPITAAGRIGVRGDNCEFLIDDLRVESIR